MTAKFKSRVMQREEKVFGSVDMNRMMVAGLWTGFVYALLRLLQVGVLMIPGVIAFHLYGPSLISMDDEVFTTVKLYQTIFPAVSASGP